MGTISVVARRIRPIVRTLRLFVSALAPAPWLQPVTLLWGLGVVTALALRVALFPFEGNDYKYFLGPWVDFIRSHGGFKALGSKFSDYPPAYLYLLAMASYLPFRQVVVIKLVSLPFDLLLAAAVGGIVREVRPGSFAASLAFLITLFAPTVFVNSALWGQCDGIYTSFLLWAVWAFMRGLPTRGVLFWGVAFAFKAQAVFLAPLLVVLFLRKNLQLRQALVAILPFGASLVPALLLGRPASELVLTYLLQAREYRELTMGAPNIYEWLPKEPYELFRTAGILLTTGAVLLILLVAVAARVAPTRSRQELLQLAMVFSLLVPFLLPGMHERYFFPADVTSIALAFARPRCFWVPVAVGLVSLLSYVPFLFGVHVLPYQQLALGVVLVLAVVLRDWVRSLKFHG